MLDWLWQILVSLWSVLSAMAPYLLLGFLVAGLLSVLVSPKLVERHLGGRGIWPIIKAALMGIPLPLCSCGVIPVSASLRRHGASKGSTVSFLISTPETGVDSIAVTYSLLGGIFAVYRVIVAFVSAIVGGMAVAIFSSKADIAASEAPPACQESCCESGSEDPRKGKLRRIVEYGFLDLPRDIGKSLIVGLLIAALIAVLVPEDFFTGGFLSGGILAMLAMAALGVPVYVCATASVPMAMELLIKGVSPGAVLVFLMVGPATNAATIAMVWRVMGKRTALIYLCSVVLVAMGAGLFMEALFERAGLAAQEIVHQHVEGVSLLNSISAVALLAILGYAIFRRPKAHAPAPAQMLQESFVLKIEGMTCSHCAQAIEKALLAQHGVKEVQVDLRQEKAFVQGNDLNIQSLVNSVTQAGYTAKPISEDIL